MADYRILKSVRYDAERLYIGAAGNENDTLPQGKFVNGSWALDVDNRKVYFYSEAEEDWIEKKEV